MDDALLLVSYILTHHHQLRNSCPNFGVPANTRKKIMKFAGAGAVVLALGIGAAGAFASNSGGYSRPVSANHCRNLYCPD